MNKRRIIILVSILAILVGSFFIMGMLRNLKKETGKPPVADLKRSVKVSKVKYGDVESEVRGVGRVSSKNQVDIIAEVQGKIQAGDIAFKKGERFKKDEVLVTIYNKDFEYNLQSRKSRFLNALANILPDLKIDYPDSYSKWEHFFQSVNIEESLPELPVVDSKQEKIFLAAKNILSEYYGIKSDEERLKKYIIYAPFTGSFTEVFLEVGSVANPGSRLARVIKTVHLEVEVPVIAEDALWIETGDKAILSKEGSNVSFDGMVVRKSDFVDPRTQSLSVFVEIDPKYNHSVFEGEYMNALFPEKKVKNVMEIPRKAVYNSNEVFVVESGLLRKKIINIKKINEKTLLFTGIEEGSELVIEPLANATENMEVSIHGKENDQDSLQLKNNELQ